MTMVLLLQLSLAAAAGLCAHETAALTHRGHHPAPYSVSQADDSRAQAADLDRNCAQCHAGCALAMTPAVSLDYSLSPSGIELPASPKLKSLSPPVPDKPKWPIGS